MKERYANFIPKYDPRGYDFDPILTNAQCIEKERLQRNGWAGGLTDEQIYLRIYGYCIDTFKLVYQQDDYWPYPLWSGNVTSFRALPFLRMFDK